MDLRSKALFRFDTAFLVVVPFGGNRIPCGVRQDPEDPAVLKELPAPDAMHFIM
jgi:hypothetical protein